MATSDSESSPRPFADFPEEEERIIQFWRDGNAFFKSYELSVKEGRKPYVFYDGPPFATVDLPFATALAYTLRDFLTTAIFWLRLSRLVNFVFAQNVVLDNY
jgi:isoleucyl-tRNA synthetase